MASPPQTWVSLKEASDRAGVSVSWLRKQYRSNGLPTREVIGTRGAQKAVPLEDVLARAATFGASARGSAPAASAATPTLPEPVAAASPTAAADASPVAAPPHASIPVTFADLLTLLERVVEVERRAAQAEAEAAYLRLRLEDAFSEIDALRDQL